MGRLGPESPEFEDLFRTFHHSAYRLETLQHYAVPYEDDLLHRFLAGGALPASFDVKYQWWRELVAESVAAGKRVHRVHVVTEPFSDYMAFELAWAYSGNSKAGEEIRILPVAEGDGWPDELPGAGRDYWLFDSRILAVMHYDPAGGFVGVDLEEDPVQVVQANGWRDAAVHASMPYKDYMKRHADPIRRAEALVALGEE